MERNVYKCWRALMRKLLTTHKVLARENIYDIKNCDGKNMAEKVI